MKAKVLWLTIIVGLSVATVRAEQFKSFAIVSADAALAKVVFSRKYPPVLEVVLRHRKARELENLTKTSLNQKVVIMINGEVVAEPIVKDTISGGTIEIQTKDEATAIRLAKSLMTKDKNSEQAKSSVRGEPRR
jgi:preprotein translocase subunit SecD